MWSAVDLPLVRTAGVAAVVAAAVLAAGFGLLGGALRAAPSGAVAVIHAVRWLDRYRYVASDLHLDGRVLHGRCYHGWFEGRRERLQRGTLLLLSNGRSIRVLHANRMLQDGTHWTNRPLVTLELAGCTRVLAPRLVTLAINADAVRQSATTYGGRPAVALRFQRLTLLVAPHTDRPLGLTLDGWSSNIRLTPLTPGTARTIEAQ
jgi:hypothetical protein